MVLIFFDISPTLLACDLGDNCNKPGVTVGIRTKVGVAPHDGDYARLPPWAQLPINRCNLPAKLLGGLSFQQHPCPLLIDGVLELHNDLFVQLERENSRKERAALFQSYMRAGFLLDHPEDAGFQPNPDGPERHKLDYRRLLRGWLFNSGSREGAVMKGWVESRFGLLARHHGKTLGDYSGAAFYRYQVHRATGLYNTNALESQLDLLYSFCQFEARKLFGNLAHLRLYRGFNRLAEHEVIDHPRDPDKVFLLNNLNSFTDDKERAGEFGDQVISTLVPFSKLLYFPELLPGLFQGEREYLVLGGLYRVRAELAF